MNLVFRNNKSMEYGIVFNNLIIYYQKNNLGNFKIYSNFFRPKTTFLYKFYKNFLRNNIFFW